MRARITTVVVLVAALLPLGANPSVADVSVSAVSFEVTNPSGPATTHTIHGDLYLPADSPGCSSSVMLLLHGLSYGRWGWDFPGYEDTLSVARALAKRGFPAVAIDELGYDASGGDEAPEDERVNGYTVTVQSYAAMTDEIVARLRTGMYSGTTTPAFVEVGLVGHSAGTEIAELTAGHFGGVDVLVATAYTHFPSQRIAGDFLTGDVPRALQDDYEYFGETPEQRSEYMYNLDAADPDVVAADNALANLTPSGEVLSISNQPSRWAMGAIDVPVLLVLAEKDLLFPVDNGGDELALFVSSPDKSLLTVPTAGHSFMLHPNAPTTNTSIADWLDDRVTSC